MSPKAFVLAAGLGTRLKPLSDRLPKPAWPFFDVPMAAHALRELAHAGVSEVVVNLHHLPDAMRQALTPHVPEGMRVQWSPEDPIRGTGGALAPWLEWAGEGPLFVVNGDTYREANFCEMRRTHEADGADATLLLHPLALGAPGPIGVDSDGRITRFLGAHAPGAGAEGLGCDFAGVHLLGPAALRALARVEGYAFCINQAVHRPLVAAGAHVQGYFPVPEPYWSDLGTPRRYLDAHFDLLARGRGPAGSAGALVTQPQRTPEGGQLFPPVYLAPGAVVEAGATLGPNAVLGTGARVRSGASLRHGVAWAGAVVQEPVEDVVVAADGSLLWGDGRARMRGDDA